MAKYFSAQETTTKNKLSQSHIHKCGDLKVNLNIDADMNVKSICASIIDGKNIVLSSLIINSKKFIEHPLCI